MKRYHGIDEFPEGIRSVVTIGTFDGVHLGHRAIISTLVEAAKRLECQSVIVTFHPHPQEVLRSRGSSVPILTTIDERAEELDRLGVDALVVVEFTRELAATPWRRFCDMLIDGLGMRHLVVGHDHAFGRDREGDVEALIEYGGERGYGVTQVPALRAGEGGETISSTKIRRALAEGDVARAREYLGRAYRITGQVVRGDGRGRSIGVPTANIRPLDTRKLVPANGVYCVGVRVGGTWYDGMANMGTRPTFTDDLESTLEANIFGFDGDICEQMVTLEFRKFTRSEQKFESLEAFLAQLERDRAACMASR